MRKVVEEMKKVAELAKRLLKGEIKVIFELVARSIVAFLALIGLGIFTITFVPTVKVFTFVLDLIWIIKNRKVPAKEMTIDVKGTVLE